jgi:FecR protein
MRRTPQFAILAVLVLLLAPLTWAESHARIVRLSYADGSVEVDRATGQGYELAIANMPITQGMRVRTGSESTAEVEFEGGSTLRLVGNTTVSFGRLSLSLDGGHLNSANVEEGTAYFNIVKKHADEFTVSFAGRELVVTDSSHFRIDVSDARVEVAMFKGRAEFADDSDTKLTKDQTLTLERDGGRTELAQGTADEPSDAWDKQRAEYIANYAEQGQPADSPYSYGMSDLAYYGSYFDVPGYGNLWRPAGMPLGWDPYNNGAWMWYPGFGYTWVSAYPWGWAPYRYGQWMWVPAYGWAWQPGNWHRWATGPVFVNAPPYYHGPHRPPHRGPTVFVGDPDWRSHHGMVTRAHDRDSVGGRRTTVSTAPGTPSRTAVPSTSVNDLPRTSPGGNGLVNVPAANAAGDAMQAPIGSVDHNPRARDRENPRGATVHNQGSPAPPARVTPAPRQQEPRAMPRSDGGGSHHDMSPGPRSAPSSGGGGREMHSSPPAPHMDAPRMQSPHTEAPHGSGGGHAGGGEGRSGGGRGH